MLALMGTIVLLCLTVACTRPAPESMNPKTKKIAGLMKALEKDGLFNGVVLVAEKGAVIYEGAHGYRRFDPKTPLDVHDRFEIGSISKPFTAVAIHQLAERGRLSLDDPLTAFFPELPYKSVTIGHLLSHTSGLFDVYEEAGLRKQFYAFYHKTDPPYTNKDYLAYLEAYKPALIGRPLEKDSYSNTAYVLLALIVEQVSGQRFDAYLHEHIFAPAGMRDSGVYSLLDDKSAANLVTGYRRDPLEGIVPNPDPDAPPSIYGLTYGDDELYTTAEDLLAFDQALRAGKLLKPTTLAHALVPPVLTDGRTARYARGFAISNVGGLRYISHTGSTAGFRAYCKFSAPDNDNTVVVLTNVQAKRDTFRAVYTAINNILRGQPYDMPRASIIYPLAEAIEKKGAFR